MKDASRDEVRWLAELLAAQPVPGAVEWPAVLNAARRYCCSAVLYWQLKPQLEAIPPDMEQPPSPQEKGINSSLPIPPPQTGWAAWRGGSVRVPPPVWQALRADYYAAVASGLTRETELQLVFETLQAAQVPALLLKGAALAYQVYPQSDLRLTADLDVLVKPGDVERARAALERVGYVYEPEPPQRFRAFDPVFTGEITLRHVRGNTQFVVEAHWELVISDVFKRVSRLNLDDIWARAASVPIGELRVPVLDRVDAFWHTCVHLALHGFTHLRGYQDIVRLAADPAFEWDEFVRRVTMRRTRTACYLALWWTREVFGAAVPDRVLQALRPGRLQAALGQRLVQRGAETLADTGHAWTHLVQFVLADRWRDWLGVIVWLFFPGPAWLQQRYRLRSRRQALAWVGVHPWVVVGEGVRNLVTLLRRSMARGAGT